MHKWFMYSFLCMEQLNGTSLFRMNIYYDRNCFLGVLCLQILNKATNIEMIVESEFRLSKPCGDYIWLTTRKMLLTSA